LIGAALRFVFIEHLLLIAAAASSFLLPVPPRLPMLLVALAAYALLFNGVGLLQVYLQTGFRFKAVAFGMGAPSALFVLLLGIVALTRVTVERILIAYLAGWAVTLLALLVFSRRSQSWPAESEYEAVEIVTEPSAWQMGLTSIAIGWPIVLANTGFGLMQSADRVTVNLTRPLHDFAIYSLSQSTIYVPITMLAAVSRVTFSWFARTIETKRATLYGSSTRLLTLLWTMLLPYYFAVEYVVHRFLPKYIPGLPAGRILLLSVLFLSLVQIVQSNTFNLHGRQRQFLASSLMAVVVAFATAWIGSEKVASLSAVAWSQVLTAGLWWLGNEWLLRDLKLQQANDMILVITTFTVATAGLYLASHGSPPAIISVLAFYALCGVPLYFFYRSEISNGWSLALKTWSRAAVKH
jgi:O-antigen/teichoic acid export membrane protein